MLAENPADVLAPPGVTQSLLAVCPVFQASPCPQPVASERMLSWAPSSVAVVEGGVRNHHLALVMRFRHMRRLIREQSRQHILKTKDLLGRFCGSFEGGGGGEGGRRQMGE